MAATCPMLLDHCYDKQMSLSRRSEGIYEIGVHIRMCSKHTGDQHSHSYCVLDICDHFIRGGDFNDRMMKSYLFP